MSKALRILHGPFGRVVLQQLDRPVMLHVHRTCQLLFHIDGPDLALSVREDSHYLGRDSVALINAWEPHSYNLAESDAPSTVLSLHLDSAWLKLTDHRLAASLHPCFFNTSCGKLPAMAHMALEDLLDLIKYDPMPLSGAVESLLLELALTLTGKYINSTSFSSLAMLGGVACDSRIRRVLSIMHESADRPIPISDLIACIGMSRPHFFRLFKQETQITPMLYASMLRMEAAIRKICETRNSLAVVANMLGFESPGNFTRFFYSHQGITPSQYRRCVTQLFANLDPLAHELEMEKISN